MANNEYNLCVNAMPFLKLPHIPPSAEDLETIDSLLRLIREALCAGIVEDYEHFIAWGSTHSPEAGCEDRLVSVVHERARHRQGLGVGHTIAQHL